MASEAANLVDHVFACAPIRQWVVTCPYEMHLLLAKRADIVNRVITIVMRIVGGWYRSQGLLDAVSEPKTGGVVVVHRFGGSLNANLHLHIPMIDGTYSFEDGKPTLRFARPPTSEDMHKLASVLRDRVVRMLTKQGLIDDEVPLWPEDFEMPAIDKCRQVAGTRGHFEPEWTQYSLLYEVRGGPRHEVSEKLDGQRRSQPQLFDTGASLSKSKSKVVATIDGFGMEAGVVMSALDRQGRERLLRYCLRPAVAQERLSILRDGNIAYRTKYGKGSKTHRVMTPMECMARLAALVPPPRRCLLRYHGVLAPHSKVRKLVVPKPSSQLVCVQAKPQTPPASKTRAKKSADETKRDTYINWATLLRRTFEIDVFDCPKCHGRMRVIALLTQPETSHKILEHTGQGDQVATGDGYAVVYDVSDEPMPDWLEGTDPSPDELYGVEPCGRDPPDSPWPH